MPLRSIVTAFVGIDVSKATLDVAIGDRPPFRVPNSPEGIDQLLARLRSQAAALVVLEATGGLERPVATVLAAAGLPVAVVNPRRVRDFAKAVGQLAETDALDAAILVDFASAVRPSRGPCPTRRPANWTPCWTAAGSWSGCGPWSRIGLSGSVTGRVRRDLEAHLRWLDERIAEMDREMTERFQPRVAGEGRSAAEHPGDRAGGQPDAAGGPAGAGPSGPASDRGAGGPGADGRRQRGEPGATAYPGWPVVGAERGVHGGAVGAAVNPALRAFAERLAAAGKKPKVILAAVSRKLVVIANAILRSGQPWNPEFAASDA